MEEETTPNIGSMSDEELKELIDKLTAEEQEVSYRGGSCTARSTSSGGAGQQAARQRARRRDPDQGRRREAAQRDPGRGRPSPRPSRPPSGTTGGDPLPRVRVRQRGGRQLLPEVRRLPLPPRGKDEPTTMTYTVDESGEMHQVDIDEVVEKAWRGAGDPRRRRPRGGELHARRRQGLDRTHARRRRLPRRRHGLAQPRAAGAPPDGLYIDDLGSLNGTYVNRRRIESHQLTDGDEIQIGKYKLSYLEKCDAMEASSTRADRQANAGGDSLQRARR